MVKLIFRSVQEHTKLAQLPLENVRNNSDWQEIYRWLSNRVGECSKSILPLICICFDDTGEIIGYYALSDHEIICNCPAGKTWPGIIPIFDTHSGKKYSPILLEHACNQTKPRGFSEPYLVTEHLDYYERLCFTHTANAIYKHGLPTKVYRKVL